MYNIIPWTTFLIFKSIITVIIFFYKQLLKNIVKILFRLSMKHSLHTKLSVRFQDYQLCSIYLQVNQFAMNRN